MKRLASAVGASPQVVSNWRTRGAPVERCADIERATGGVVMRWDLRPDDWHRIWPELVNHERAPQVLRQEAPNAA